MCNSVLWDEKNIYYSALFRCRKLQQSGLGVHLSLSVSEQCRVPRVLASELRASFLLSTAPDTHVHRVTEDRQHGLRVYGKKRQQARTFCQESSKQNTEGKKAGGGGRMQWMHKRVSVRRDDKPET